MFGTFAICYKAPNRLHVILTLLQLKWTTLNAFATVEEIQTQIESTNSKKKEQKLNISSSHMKKETFAKVTVAGNILSQSIYCAIKM